MAQSGKNNSVFTFKIEALCLDWTLSPGPNLPPCFYFFAAFIMLQFSSGPGLSLPGRKSGNLFENADETYIHPERMLPILVSTSDYPRERIPFNHIINTQNEHLINVLWGAIIPLLITQSRIQSEILYTCTTIAGSYVLLSQDHDEKGIRWFDGSVHQKFRSCTRSCKSVNCFWKHFCHCWSTDRREGFQKQDKPEDLPQSNSLSRRLSGIKVWLKSGESSCFHLRKPLHISSFNHYSC